MVSSRLAPVRARSLCWVSTDAGRAWLGGTTTKLASRIPARSHEPVEVVKRGTNFEACMSDKNPVAKDRTPGSSTESPWTQNTKKHLFVYTSKPLPVNPESPARSLNLRLKPTITHRPYKALICRRM